jgi:hypothetical protein
MVYEIDENNIEIIQCKDVYGDILCTIDLYDGYSETERIAQFLQDCITFWENELHNSIIVGITWNVEGSEKCTDYYIIKRT